MTCPKCNSELEELPSYRVYCETCDVEGEYWELENEEGE